MSSFDFAMTIAVGSMIATVIITDSVSILKGSVAIGSLFVLQGILALLRSRTEIFSRLIDNEPKLLMLDGKILYDALKQTRVTEDDLVAKLRESNVLKHSQVKAVVLETTGDISVLHTGDDTEMEPRMLKSVRGANYGA